MKNQTLLAVMVENGVVLSEFDQREIQGAGFVLPGNQPGVEMPEP